MLSFGYHVYNGLQLKFTHPSDKSVAFVDHRDVDLENHPNVKAHGHDGELETEFDAHVFDSQFKRYAQVFDTDYDNYMVMYQCFETAHFYDKETGKRIPGYEAWLKAKSSAVDLNARP